MTLGEIKDYFWLMLGGSAGPRPWLEDETLDAWAGEAVRDLVEHTKCLDRRKAMLVSSGTYAYDLPDDCKRVKRVAYDGDKLEHVSQLYLQRSGYDWEHDSATPRYYFVDGLNGQIGLNPVPIADTVMEVEEEYAYGGLVSMTGYGGIVDTTEAEILPQGAGGIYEAIAGLELELYYDCSPPALEDDNSVPAVPAWAHPLIVYYMLKSARASLSPMRDLDQAAFWGGLYLNGRKRLLARANGRLPKEWLIRTRDYGLRPNLSRMPDIVNAGLAATTTTTTTTSTADSETDGDDDPDPDPSRPDDPTAPYDPGVS